MYVCHAFYPGFYTVNNFCINKIKSALFLCNLSSLSGTINFKYPIISFSILIRLIELGINIFLSRYKMNI